MNKKLIAGTLALAVTITAAGIAVGTLLKKTDLFDQKQSVMDEKKEDVQDGQISEKETEKKTEKESETSGESEGKEAATEKMTESKAEPAELGEKETELLLNGFTVGIDPGHQGSWVNMSDTEPNGPGSSEYKAKATTGTQGKFTGVPEYELALDISKALREELEHRGYQVVLTREDHDTAISNSERALLAAEKGSDIYVRVHANGSDDSSVNGALMMTPSESNPYVGNLAKESYRLSECILNAYCGKTGFKNDGILYTDNMTGINWSKVPVTIIEMGFMTNEADDRAMQDPEMQKKMVDGIADGIDDYFHLDHQAIQNDTASSQKDNASSDETGMNLDEAANDNNIIDGTVPMKQDPSGEIVESCLEPLIMNGQKWAFSIENLKTKEVCGFQEDEPFQSASVIKTFIMATVYDRMCYPSSPDRLISANESHDGELRSLLEAMITVSDNDASNTLITKLGEGDFEKGAAIVNEFCKENGYLNTSVGRKFLDPAPKGDNYTSARDCRKILADIYEGKCVCPEASEKMLGILKGQTNKSKIPSGIPAEWTSANKTGEMPEGHGLGCIENDIAIVFTPKGDYILTVLSNELGGSNDQAVDVIRKISSFTANLFK